MGLNPSDSSGDVTITFADAIVRILAVEIRGIPRMHLSRGAAAEQLPPLSFCKWGMHKATGVLAGGLHYCGGSKEWIRSY